MSPRAWQAWIAPAALLAPAALVAGEASALATYVYVGNPFDTFVDRNPPEDA